VLGRKRGIVLSKGVGLEHRRDHIRIRSSIYLSALVNSGDQEEETYLEMIMAMGELVMAK
jgi:hypothetical protein